MFCYLLAALFALSPLQATSGFDLQKEADSLRENGQSLQAIHLYNQALVQFQEDRDYANLMNTLTGRLLAWKHLFYKTGDKIYAIFVKKEAETLFDVAKTHHLVADRLHLLHYMNGTAATLLNDYSIAEKELGQAVAFFPKDNAEKGDWIAHLGEAIYKNGKKEEGKTLILEGVKKINENASQVDPFLYNVWVSGAYLRLAKLLKKDNPEESQLFLQKAKQIIDADKRLVIRKQQLEEFKKI